MGIENSTEQKILEAADDIFQEKGFDGARMQEIAAQAGINKGLLHYYFKTKDKLFEAIFSVAINRMISKILVILEQEVTLEEKIGMIVDQYMHLLQKNPTLPRFVLNEINKNADKFIARHINKEASMAFEKFAASAGTEINAGHIKPVDPRQLFTNMMSMLLFPFVGRPMLQTVLHMDNNEFKEMMAARAEHIKGFIKDALRN